jgi:hypothetical protein
MPGLRKILSELIGEGVQTVGLETMQSIKNRIREGIIQAEIEGLWLRR